MQGHTEVKMLVVLVVMMLLTGGSDGLNNCDLRNDLKAALPKDVLTHITNDLAKIVCQVNVLTNFNTNITTYKQIIHRRRRSVNDHHHSSDGNGLESSLVKPPHPTGTTGASNANAAHTKTTPHGSFFTGGRRPRHVHSTGKQDVGKHNSTNHMNMTAGHTHDDSNESKQYNGKGHPRSVRSVHKFKIAAEWAIMKDSKEEFKEEFKGKPKPEFDMEHHDESNEEQSSEESKEESKEESSEESSEESKKESSEESSEESKEESKKKSSEEFDKGEEMHMKPKEHSSDYHKDNFSSSTVTTHTVRPINASTMSAYNVTGGRRSRSVKQTTYNLVLYGILQLPGNIACSSGPGNSLNLCNMTCNNLLNGNITDDIVCLGTLLKATWEVEKHPSHPPYVAVKQFLEEIGHEHATDFLVKLYDFMEKKKQCTTVNNANYFNSC